MKILITETQLGILKEYITNDINYLKKYLTQSDEEKKADLPYQYPYFIDDFLYDNDIDVDIPEDYEQEEKVEWLKDNDNEIYNEYSNWLFKKINNFNLRIPETDYPSWAYMYDAKILKNQWLIHFTDDADEIAREGFKLGVSEYDRLGLTKHMSNFDKEFGGYNFAYTLNDFQRYGYQGYGKYKYGNEAVLFRASGIRTYHNGDEEEQVIFYGNTARNIIPITSGENDDFAVYTKNGRLLYENDSLPKVVDWVVKNYVQYRKQLE